jgi:hypothetical protein
MKILFIVLAITVITAAEVHAQSDGFYEISRLPFTSDYYNEFAPAWYGEGLVFTSNRKKGFLISRLTYEGDILFNIYYTSPVKAGRWQKPEIFSKSLMSNYHDGPVSFSHDGTRVYFTRNLPGKGNEASKLGIFMAEQSGGKWVNITPFPYNSNDYNTTHPSISQDGKTLYFSSDMPGGFGGMDIYSSSVLGYGWSAPVNLGENINSSREEVFPYIHSGGKLYYSSNKGASGQFDLYFSAGAGNAWQLPVRLPEPFNSEADDFGFIASSGLDSGYFSSSREGSDNIYSFISTFPVFSHCEAIREPELCYIFYEETGEVDTTTFYFEWDMGDGTKISGREADHCFEDTGTYSVRLNVIDLLTGDIAYNKASYNFRIERIKQAFITSPDTCYVGQQILLDASESYLPDYEIEGYYWEPGDGARVRGGSINHAFTRPGIYEIRLGVLPAGSPDGQKRSCVYRQITVLENVN